jgi:hypothetical protein
MAVGIVLGVLLLDLVLITHSEDQLREQFRRSAEPLERLLADYVNLYVDNQDIPALSTSLQTWVPGDLLYGQVVVNGQVLAERLAPKVEQPTLPVEPLPPNAMERTIVRRLASGESYLDVRLGLTSLAVNRNGEIARSDPATTYLRLGYSMIAVDLEIGRYSIFILSVSVLLLIAIGLLFWLITWWTGRAFKGLHPHQAADIAAQGQEAVPPAKDAGQVTERISDNGIGATAPLCRRLQLRGGQLLLDEGRKQIAFDGQQITLSPKEYKLFMQLASNPARTFSDEEIIREVWGTEGSATSKDVKQYIYFLRRKLGDDSEMPKFIETVRGHGYKLAI